MKLSQWAKNNSLSYQTALNHWRRGLINGKQLATGTIVVFEDDNSVVKNKILQVATYARVSSSENKHFILISFLFFFLVSFLQLIH